MHIPLASVHSRVLKASFEMQVGAGLQKEEIRRLEQRCAESDLHSGMLAQRLARSDQLRMDQVRAIEQLRHELVDMQSKLPSRRTPGAAPLTARKSAGHAHARDASASTLLKLSVSCCGLSANHDPQPLCSCLHRWAA